MRLRDLVTGEVTHREVISYIHGLPRDSAVHRALLGDAADCTAEWHRLTDIADLLAAANWQRGSGKGRRPKPIKRPRVPDVDV